MTSVPQRPGSPDYESAVNYALSRLRAELPNHLHYHCVWHTEGDVLPAARLLAKMENLSESDAGRLDVAAAFHDLGHVIESDGHEQIGIDIAKSVLPQYGFSDSDIESIAGMVRATSLPQAPRNLLEQLMVDADLDSLGRDDFFKTSEALWRENSARGRGRSWDEWLQIQLHFLQNHRYFTPSARTLRDAGKQKNIALLERRIAEQQGT